MKKISFFFFFSVIQRKEANVEKLTQRKNKYNDRCRVSINKTQ